MTVSVLYPNQLGRFRAASGLTPDELAARAELDRHLYAEIEAGRLLPTFPELERIRGQLGDVAPIELYGGSLVNTIGDQRYWQSNIDYKRFYESMADTARLLVAPDEMLWLDRDATPDREVDVFLNMSCGTQMVPHVMLDAAAVFDALGVRYASGAGPQYCCGTYYRRTGRLDGTTHMNAATVKRFKAWGASVAVHGCTQCVNTFTEIARRQAWEGTSQGVHHVQLLRFLDERLTELGDRVPWKKEVDAAVLPHGHAQLSYVHELARRDVANVARHIPGVRVVETPDRTAVDDFCDLDGDDPRNRVPPKNLAEVAAYRYELARIAVSWGASVISPQHQTCLRKMTPLASEGVQVRHVISLLAESLGVGHPDRFAAASRLGDSDPIVEQTRSIWTQWNMTEERARQTARAVFDPAYADIERCACGRTASGQCGHQGDKLIPIDVLAGRSGLPVA